jgi:hypothetical protein
VAAVHAVQHQRDFLLCHDHYHSPERDTRKKSLRLRL